MRRYRLDISYDGTAYSGWQIQPNGITVQECLEQALAKLTQENPKVHGSGRTDQGVHARRQVAHVDLETSAFTEKKLRRGMNAMLPKDIRVMNITRARADFHARRSAVSKEYRYFIWNSEIMPPVYRYYKAHITTVLDVDAMREAAEYLLGEHDFAAFAANPDREVETTVRNVTRLDVKKKGSEIVILVRSNGFLYKMVRSLAGFLLKVGEGVAPPSAAVEILASRTRTARVPTARPHGLFLWSVWY